MADKKSKKRKKKKSLGFKITMSILGILIFAIAAATSYGVSLINKIDNVKLNNKDLGITESEDLSQYKNLKSIKNIALFGVDAEDGNVGRSDSIMIATVDPVHNKVKISSIMRDTYVNIEGHGMDKINHAYAFGGPTLAIKTLNQNFGLNIEDFVSVNFSTLPEIIDTVGGVEVTITDEEVSHINGISAPGTYTLNGSQALDYSRIRYASGGDYERTHRQRVVLSALFTKGMNLPVSSYTSVLSDVLPLVQTSLETGDILGLCTKVAGMGSSTLEQQRYPLDGYGEGQSINGTYYLVTDLNTTKKQMQDYIFDDKIVE